MYYHKILIYFVHVSPTIMTVTDGKVRNIFSLSTPQSTIAQLPESPAQGTKGKPNREHSEDSCEYKSCNGRRCKRSHSTSKEEYWRNVCCDIHSLSRPRECPELPQNEESNHSSAQVKSSIVKPSYQNEKKGSTRNTENKYDDHG